MRAWRVDRSRLKLALAGVLFLLLMAAAGLLLALGGKAIFLTERGGQAAPIDNAIIDLDEQEPGRLAWLPDAATVQRAIDDGTRERIADAYLRGWRQIELALRSCTTDGLRTYFGPGPSSQLEALVADAEADGCLVRRSDGAHRLRLTFVSEDGGLVALTDERHWYVDRLPVDDGDAAFVTTTSARDLVMRLDDGEWRVTAWHQRPVSDDVEARPTKARLAEALPTDFTAARGRQLVVDGRTYAPEGVNYYPAETPWRAFWTEYDPRVIDADLDRAQALGFDALRIFVPFGTGPVRPADDVIDRLDDFLDRASSRELRVVVTLFDLDFDYRPSAWAAADHYLERLLPRFADDPTILAWDLKNEPDLDDARVGRSLVDAWLRHVITTARSFDPNHLLTVGWSDPRWADRLAPLLDLVSVHDYGDPAALPDRLGAAAESTPTKPLWLSEYGASSHTSFLVPSERGEAGQAAHLAAVRGGLASMPSDALAGRFVWSLRDHSMTAPAPDGVRPWRRGVQRTFGLIRTDGSPKPAAAAIGGDAISEPPAIGPYLSMLALAAAWGLSVGLVWWRRRRGRAVAALALAVAHPVGYLVLGLALTVLLETLRIELSSPLVPVGLLLAISLLGWWGLRFAARFPRPQRKASPEVADTAGAAEL
jgi:hypothetical protein